jgi:hypothetical protein
VTLRIDRQFAGGSGIHQSTDDDCADRMSNVAAFTCFSIAQDAAPITLEHTLEAEDDL